MTHPNFPPSEEHAFERRPRNIVNRIECEDWREFCSQAAATDELGAEYQINDAATVQWVGEQTSELNFIFGEEYFKKYCRVIGIGYSEHQIRDGNVSPNETIVIDVTSASLQGVDIQYLNGAWRTLLQFHIAQHTNHMPGGMYYIPPNQQFLLELTIDLGDQEKKDEFVDDYSTPQLLAEEVEAAQTHIAHASFTEYTAEEQRRLLQEMICEADEALDPLECGHNVTIESLCHYTLYDDMAGFDPHDLYTDQQNLAPDDRCAIVGEIQGHAYPELADLPDDTLLSQADFTYNNGAPCLVIRNDDLRCTYYILAQHIITIT